jgi:arylsulfatase A-like enzyme
LPRNRSSRRREAHIYFAGLKSKSQSLLTSAPTMFKRMTRGTLSLTQTALLFLSLAFSDRVGHAAEAPRRPNILVVIADQWRSPAFGYAGDPNVKTPNFDQLERESVRFFNAVSGLPVCSPTRASLLTGQRPLTHGVFLNDVLLNTNAVTIAKVLRAAGYDTGYIGKWHLNGDGRSNFIPPERRQGFDYWKALECTHNYTNSFYYADGPEKLKWTEYDAFAQTRDAQEFLRGRAKSDRPFILFLAWGPPHDPYFSAPEKYRAMYDPAKLTLRPNIPPVLQDAARKILAGYYAHCTALDDSMGDLRRTLAEVGLDDNTILAFTADHGDMLGSQGLYKKQKPYDESIRVPMLFHWPRGLGPQTRLLDAPINSEDVMPTLLGLASVPIPKAVEGLDYSGYMRGGPNPGDGATVILCAAPFGEWERRAGGKEYRGLCTVRYTYVRDLSGPWLLFDNLADPHQTNNLVNLPAHTKLQSELETMLNRKLRERDDQFLPADAYIKKWGYLVNPNGTVPYTP